MQAHAVEMTRSGDAPVAAHPAALQAPVAHVAGVRVLVLHASELVLWGCRALLGRQEWVERCLVAADPADALALASRYEPHVALVQAGDTVNAAKLVAKLREAHPRIRVLLVCEPGRLTTSDARAVGGLGAVDSTLRAPQLLQLVRSAAAGVSPPTPRSSATVRLSARERQVLSHLATGATNREIGDSLVLSPDTIKNHVSRAYRKLGARNRLEAVNRARALGLL